MTPEERIDAALDSVLTITSGSTMRYYKTLFPTRSKKMREAMRKIMVYSYIQGSNDAHDAMKGDQR
jgi:hypothetical protein